MQDEEHRISVPRWTTGPVKRFMTTLAFPFVLLLNRPAFRALAEAAYDVALRMNGFAINFPGRNGLGYAEERFLARLLSPSNAGTLFDVGANNGAYSREMRRLAPAATIHAFEPHPKTFGLLGHALASFNVVQVNKALSDKGGTMTLHDFADDDGSTQASLSAASVQMFGDDIVSYSVDVTTIDDYMAANGIDTIDLLKIDTEGFDLNVLKGARKAIEARRIKAIQFEIIPADIALHVTVREFFEALPAYRLHRLCLNGSLLPLDRYDVKRCEIYVTHNIVALP